jgi:hypothetical protein
MGLQKYRAEKEGDKQKNGGTPFYTCWAFGPSLALIRNCKIENIDLTPRTVYVRGEADTFFSIPAACQSKGKTITGYLTTDDNCEMVFRAHNDQVP